MQSRMILVCSWLIGMENNSSQSYSESLCLRTYADFRLIFLQMFIKMHDESVRRGELGFCH